MVYEETSGNAKTSEEGLEETSGSAKGNDTPKQVARPGDIVYMGSEGIYPHKVITVGYATYEGQVRIARIDGNFHEWSTGF